MAVIIRTNVASLQAQKHLDSSQKALQSSYNKLASGYRVNSAKDDAAGLAISESMKSQIRSFNVAERNASDGISMAQTAEGSLNEVHGILGRMRELAMQAGNGGLTSTDRGYMDGEFKALQSEVSRIQGSAKFNGQSLVNQTASSVTFLVGLNNVASDKITVTFGGVSLTAVASGGAASLGGATSGAALSALSTIDTAIKTVSTARSKFGTAMNRLDVATGNIQTMRTNLSAANSRIRDVDVASETAALSQNQVLSQAGVSILAQANQIPQTAFGLLG
jgi:flagellin